LFIRNPISRAVFHGANQQYKKESTNVKNTIKYNKIGKTLVKERAQDKADVIARCMHYTSTQRAKIVLTTQASLSVIESISNGRGEEFFVMLFTN
jgi:hypothetical protein